MMEDLLEELVGEISGEWEPRGGERVRLEEDGALLVDGDVQIRDLNRDHGFELPEAPGYSTVAGLCLELAGRIPAREQKFTTEDGTELEVVAATARYVRCVRIRRPERPPE